MRVTISSSSNDKIDEIYLNESRKALEYLASKGYDLNWGSGNRSIMGLSYEIFSFYNRKIYGYTTSKYADEIKDLPNATHNIYEDTFDLKKHIYNDADIVICLPGGTGTVSELLAYIEESRSNDNYKEIILYNINDHFKSTLELIKDLINRNFNSEGIYDFFKVINSFEEFKNYIDKNK